MNTIVTLTCSEVKSHECRTNPQSKTPSPFLIYLSEYRTKSLVQTAPRTNPQSKPSYKTLKSSTRLRLRHLIKIRSELTEMQSGNGVLHIPID